MTGGSRRSVFRIVLVVAIGLAVSVSPLWSSPASAAHHEAKAKAKTYQVCWWFTDNEDATFDCDSQRFKAPVAVVDVGIQCWSDSAPGAFAQQLVNGQWADRADIPVTVTPHAACPAGTNHVSTMRLSLPVAPFAVSTYRVVVPESAEYAQTEGHDIAVCIRAKANPRHCG